MEKKQNRPITVGQMKSGRALVGWTLADLRDASGLSDMTLKRLEGGEIGQPLGGTSTTRNKLTGALEAAGVIFIDENGEGPGVRLRKA